MNEPSCMDFNFDIEPCEVCVERMWKTKRSFDGICWVEYYHNEISRSIPIRDLVQRSPNSPYHLTVVVRNYFPNLIEDLNKLLILIE